MAGMFTSTTSLRTLTLSPDFRFVNSAGSLPDVRRNVEFTGYWQNVGWGTIERPRGEYVFTSAQLMAQYDGATMADTFVWQPAKSMAYSQMSYDLYDVDI